MVTDITDNPKIARTIGAARTGSAVADMLSLPNLKDGVSCEKLMNTLSRITTDPQLCGGRPCIRHMRIRVKDILDLLASGASTAEILEDYPYLEADDIKASFEYAAHLMDHPILSVA